MNRAAGRCVRPVRGQRTQRATLVMRPFEPALREEFPGGLGPPWARIPEFIPGVPGRREPGGNADWTGVPPAMGPQPKFPLPSALPPKLDGTHPTVSLGFDGDLVRSLPGMVRDRPIDSGTGTPGHRVLGGSIHLTTKVFTRRKPRRG